MSLRLLHELPDHFFTWSARDLHRALGGPTLIMLSGAEQKPLFVSCLLHGNEHSGWSGMQTMVRQWQFAGRPRSLMLFIANTRAAEAGLRQLPGDDDFNRIWGTDYRGPHHSMTQALLEQVARQVPWAVVDLHNNSGRNPTYACLAALDDLPLRMAQLFTPRILHVNGHHNALSVALGAYAPAIALECSTPGEQVALAQLQHFFVELLKTSALEHLPTRRPATQALALYASIKLASDLDVHFSSTTQFVRERPTAHFIPSLDQFNFIPHDNSRLWGHLSCSRAQEKIWIENAGQRLSLEEFFQVKAGASGALDLIAMSGVIPAMLTTDATIARNDCLGHLLKPIDHDKVIG